MARIVVSVPLLVLALLSHAVAAAQADAGDGTMTSWAWSSAVIEGDVGVRLTMDFGHENACVTEVRVWAEISGAAELFYGREDDSVRFFVGDMHGPTAISGAWNIEGDVDLDGTYLPSDVRGMVMTHAWTHDGVERWMIVGSSLTHDASALYDAALAIGIRCDGPFTIQALEASREIAWMHTEICREPKIGPVEVHGCNGAAVAQSANWNVSAPSTVLRFHSFSFSLDAGHIRLTAPDEEVESFYSSSGFHAAEPGFRVRGGPGTYGYGWTHVGVVPWVAFGVLAGFWPVQDLDQVLDLPTL